MNDKFDDFRLKAQAGPGILDVPLNQLRNTLVSLEALTEYIFLDFDMARHSYSVVTFDGVQTKNRITHHRMDIDDRKTPVPVTDELVNRILALRIVHFENETPRRPFYHFELIVDPRDRNMRVAYNYIRDPAEVGVRLTDADVMMEMTIFPSESRQTIPWLADYISGKRPRDI